MNNELRRMAVTEKRAGWRWSSARAMSAAIVILGLAALLVALTCSVSRSRANNARAFRRLRTMSTVLSKPFPGSALRDSLVQAIDHCSR